MTVAPPGMSQQLWDDIIEAMTRPICPECASIPLASIPSPHVKLPRCPRCADESGKIEE